MRKFLIFAGLFISCELQAQNNTTDIGFNLNDDALSNANFQEQLIADSVDFLKINFADSVNLLQSGFFTVAEVDSILKYRNQYGYFFSIEEMQSLGLISIERLAFLKPSLSFELPVALNHMLNLKRMDGRVVFRMAIPFSSNNTNEEGNYNGNSYREAIGVKINAGEKINFVFNAEKDAGEQFEFTKKVKGFDYNSAHLTIKNIRSIYKVVFGDYQIQLGQGLAIWQGMSLGKSSDIVTIRKQESGIKEYNGMSEFGFFRGAAIEYKIKKVKITNWCSVKNQDATVYNDSIDGLFIHTIKTDGYHRTALELANKNVLQQVVVGSSCSMIVNNITIGLNAVFTTNSIKIKPEDELYKVFSFNGRDHFNQSLSFSGTKNNFNYFGEMAIDQNFSIATVNGFIASIEKNLSVSLLHRYYSKNYFSFHSNGFGENNQVVNEKGIFIGANYTYNKKMQLSAYYDLYAFPWLKYQLNMPSYGSDYSLQMIYSPSKTTSISLRYHQTKNQESDLLTDIHSKDIIDYYSRTIRFQIRTEMKRLQITARYDFNFLKQQGVESGMLAYFDVQYKPMLKPFSFSLRASIYQTDSYVSRVYAYQGDLPGSYNLGAFYGRGESVYAMIHYKVGRNIQLWLRGSRTLSYAQVADNKGLSPDYEMKIQVSYQF